MCRLLRYIKWFQWRSILTFWDFATVGISWRLITQMKLWGCRDPRRQIFGKFSQGGLETQVWRKTQGFLPNTRRLDTHRHSRTGLRNLRGHLCMTQGFALNGSPGKVLYCIVCWFVGRSSGGCYSDCLHFLSVTAHIKDRVLVSIIVTNWILHFPRTHVTNLQQSESVWVCVCLCVEGKKIRQVCFRCARCNWGKIYRLLKKFTANQTIWRFKSIIINTDIN